MMRKPADKGRDMPCLSNLLSTTCTITSGTHSESYPVRDISMLVVAAFLCSCHIDLPTVPPEQEKESVQQVTMILKSTENPIRSAHVLTFNADSLGWLDSYQYIDGIENGEITIASTSGNKRSHIYTGLYLGDEDMAKINSRYDLEKMHTCLEDVRPDSPPMLGIAETGTHGRLGVEMTSMLSEVVLRSVSCDFKGTSYEGEHIKDARIYLTNVNAEESLSGNYGSMKRLINVGRLAKEDIGRFALPGIIVQDIGEDISDCRLTPEISLYCFPNTSDTEGPGSPFTKLILEGKIQDTTYYWPIAINREDGGNGIKRNCRYVYDLTIRRKGCLDPEDEIQEDIYDKSEEDQEQDEMISFKYFPDSFIRGDIGDTLHLWCEFTPSDAPFYVGTEELEEDKANGIYDYIIDEDGHGVWLILKGPGSGLVYMKAGAPVNEAALWVIEVNLPKEDPDSTGTEIIDTLLYGTSHMMPTAQGFRRKRDGLLGLRPQVRDRSPNPPHG